MVPPFGIPCSQGKDLADDLQGLALGLGNVKEYENPGNECNYRKETEHSLQTETLVQNRKRVCDADIACPHSSSTDPNAGATHSSRENLRAKNVGDGTKAGHESTDEDCHADEGNQCGNKTSCLEKVHDHKWHQRDGEGR